MIQLLIQLQLSQQLPLPLPPQLQLSLLLPPENFHGSGPRRRRGEVSGFVHMAHFVSFWAKLCPVAKKVRFCTHGTFCLILGQIVSCGQKSTVLYTWHILSHFGPNCVLWPKKYGFVHMAHFVSFWAKLCPVAKKKPKFFKPIIRPFLVIFVKNQ
jgi:hypothetical protein